MAVTDQDFLTQIQYTLIEPVDGGLTWASQLWTTDEVLGYINQRQNRFMRDTGLLLSIAEIPGVIGQHDYDLPEDWIATQRVVWISDDPTIPIRELARSDTWEADLSLPDWDIVNGTPKFYAESTVPTDILQLVPAPDAAGTIQVIYTAIGDPVDGGGQIFVVPDEFIPALKWGVIADMLIKVGRAQDLTRIQAAEQQYAEGVEAALILLKGWA